MINFNDTFKNNYSCNTVAMLHTAEGNNEMCKFRYRDLIFKISQIYMNNSMSWLSISRESKNIKKGLVQLVVNGMDK